ncbi:hypothetical protein GCM10027048_42630 [Hymenobacter coalescens]
MNQLHTLNIGLHIAGGTLALLLGLVPLLGRKGGAIHRRFGRWFLGAVGVVLVTAVLGLVVFDFRAYLVGIVLLSGYRAWAGVRVLRLRATGPRRLDAVAAALALVGGVGFLVSLHLIRLVWSPVVIYSTVGALLLMSVYDLARFAFVPLWRRRLWLPDHIWKMVSSYFALVSAFTGTVLPQYKPYSQLLPSTVGVALALGFIGYYSWRRAAAHRAWSAPPVTTTA